MSWKTGSIPLLVETAKPTVNKLTVLLDKYADVFVNNPGEPLGRTNEVEHCIDTGDSQPVKQRPYRTPVHLQNVVNKQVKEMLGKWNNVFIW